MVASEVEAVGEVLALAVREMDGDNFANWLKEHSVQKLLPKREGDRT